MQTHREPGDLGFFHGDVSEFRKLKVMNPDTADQEESFSKEHWMGVPDSASFG